MFYPNTVWNSGNLVLDSAAQKARKFVVARGLLKKGPSSQLSTYSPFPPSELHPQTLNGRTGRLGSSCVSRFPLHHHHWHRPLPAKHHHHTTVAPGSSHWHPHLSTTTALQSHPSTTIHATIQCPNLPHLPRFPCTPSRRDKLRSRILRSMRVGLLHAHQQ